MPKFLVLDDDVNRHELFSHCFKMYAEMTGRTYDSKHVYTAKDCISALENDSYDIVFLDHDLGGRTFVDSDEEDCGMTVVKWLTGQEEILCRTLKFIIHSLNAPAAKLMRDRINAAKDNKAVCHAGIFIPSEFQKVIS